MQDMLRGRRNSHGRRETLGKASSQRKPVREGLLRKTTLINSDRLLWSLLTIESLSPQSRLPAWSDNGLHLLSSHNQCPIVLERRRAFHYLLHHFIIQQQQQPKKKKHPPQLVEINDFYQDLLIKMAPLFDTLLALLGMSSYLVSINNTTTNTTTNMTDIANVHNTATISLADPQVHLPTSLGLGLGLGLGPDHTRLDNLLSRRDFVWTDTNNQPQNLCGDSSFYTVDGGSGPARADCQEFISYAVSRDGYWLVTQFGNLGLDWQEFVVLESCKVAVRHADGAQGTIA